MDWAQHFDMLSTIWMAMRVDDAGEKSDEESDIESDSSKSRGKAGHAPEKPDRVGRRSSRY